MQQEVACFEFQDDATLIGDALSHVRERLSILSETHHDVLLIGPSGSGKEVAAKMLHRMWNRRSALVPVNCAAIPEALFEAELFGHARGAFTGAIASTTGRLTDAEDGILLLDEIGDMPLSLQPKLLRVLESRRYRPVGGGRELHFRGRVLAATCVDLRAAVEHRRFRLDLFHRLNRFEVRLPSLAERRTDIASIALHIAAKQVPPVTLSRTALLWLEAQDWPGNVREQNLIVRASVFAKGTTVTPELLRELRGADSDSPIGLMAAEVRAFKRELARRAFAKHGTISETARALGVTRRTLRSLLREGS